MHLLRLNVVEEIKMEFRRAVMNDLPQLKAVYKEIIKNMNYNQIQIWDDIYPCDYFEEDIKNTRLYLLLNHGDIVSAFALCEGNPGEKTLQWGKDCVKALYLDRLGVNVNYLRKGMGSLTLAKAKEAAKALNAQYLRLFVVDINEPAICLYVKNGFTRVAGVYDEVIDEDLVLHEYGYEIRL